MPTPAPVANFHSNGVITAPAGTDIAFIDSSTGEIETYEWDFGDGAQRTKPYKDNANESHRWATPGTYVVKLQVIGPGGANMKTKTGYVITTP